MLHPSTELRFISPEIGYGVVATERIPRGTITWALDDLDVILDPKHIRRMIEPLQQKVEKYAYMDGRGRYILCWDLAKYMNHACDANCLGLGYEFEMAIRDIEPGEQLTDDYGGLNIEAPFECRCGSPECRGTIRPDDILALHERWDDVLTETLPLLRTVAQPLWPILRCQREIQEVLDGVRPATSSRSHYHPVAR